MNKKAQSELAIASTVANDVALFGGLTTTGFENTTAESFQVPTVRLLQKTSGEVTEGDANYLPEAKPGMFIDSVSRQIFDDFTFVQVQFKQTFVESKLNTKGSRDLKGYVTEHPSDNPLIPQSSRVDGRGYLLTPHGTGLFDTRKHYILRLSDDGSIIPCIMTLGSTQIRTSKRLMANLRMQTFKDEGGVLHIKPTFGTIVKASSTVEQSEEGSYYGWKLEMLSPLSSADIRDTALSFNTSLNEGKLKEAPVQETEF